MKVWDEKATNKFLKVEKGGASAVKVWKDFSLADSSQGSP